MMRRNPTLIIRFSATRYRGTIGSQYANLIAGIDFLGPSGRAFSTVAAFPTACFLREERRDPGVIDEIACAAKSGEEEQVEEYAERGRV